MNHCIEYQSNRDFYLHVLQKLQHGQDLTAELPEVAEIPKSHALKVCAQLAEQADEAATHAWQLSAAEQKLFDTSINTKKHDHSMLTCYEILYQSKKQYGSVQIKINTYRNNLVVRVNGDAKSIDSFYGEFVNAQLRS